MYGTIEALRSALTAILPTVNRSAAQLSDADLTTALEDAAAEIDAALSPYYAIPVTGPDDGPTPDLVTRIALNIAAYVATLQARGSADLSERDPAVLRYQRARVLLSDIASGRLTIDAARDAGDTTTTPAFSPTGYDTNPVMDLASDITLPTYK